MAPKLIFVSLLAVCILSFTSCKKDKDEAMTAEEVAATILGKWQISSLMYNNNYNGVDHKETFTGTDADYVEFKSDGKVYTSFRGTTDVSNYKVKNNEVILIDDDPTTIKEISDNKLTLYTKDATGSFGFTEVIYTLKR